MNPTLPDKSKIIGRFFIYVTMFVSGLVSFLDLFGLLESVEFIKSRQLTLTLLIISGLVVYLTSLGRKLDDIESSLVIKIDAIESSMHTLQAHVNQDTIEKVKSLRHQLDKNLEVIYGDMISDSLNNIERALKERTIKFNDLELFRYLYKRTLEKYPRATFLATSLPYKRFFWRNPMMEDAIKKFIEDGGTMQRIFFVKSLEELKQEEVKQVIADQCKIGVEVFVTIKDKIPPHLRRIFVVDQEKRIAWEVNVDQDSEIIEVKATTNSVFINEYLRCFETLIGSNSTNRQVVNVCEEPQ
jgi:hypothetical protein